MSLINKIALFSIFAISPAISASNDYAPVLYNFSLLYDFPPVAGKVKNLDINVEDEQGDVIYTLSASMSQEQCIDNIQINDKAKKSEIILARDGRSLKGIKDWSIIVFSLDEQCNISSKMENGGIEEYGTTDNGLLASVRFMGNKVSDFIYDEHGFLTRTRFYSSRGETASNTLMYSDPERKRQDYKLVHQSRYSDAYVAEHVCQYDPQGTPTVCELRRLFDGKSAKKTQKLKIFITASFY